jgi:hypothetical protein
MRRDPLRVEWQRGQLGRRTANEAVEEQEAFAPTALACGG